MQEFILDPKLKNDTHELGRLNNQVLLLMDNALIPWFILVPITQVKEVDQLDAHEQTTLLKNINTLSKHIRHHFPVTKLNIGAIGNIVSQLHIHIIGRSKIDYAWPNVVWGNPNKKPYSSPQVKHILNQLISDKNITTVFQTAHR